MKIRDKNLNFILTLLFTLVIIDLIARSKYSHQSQLLILILTTSAYLIWAFVYHKLDKSLTYNLYLEYVLTATLAIILLLGIFNI